MIHTKPHSSGAAFSPERLRRAAILCLLMCAAILIHGYHLGVDDAAIYLPAVKRVFDPQLFPFNAEFFMAHSQLSIFAWLTGGSARLLHIPVDVAIFAWQVLGIFALLVAAWRIASLCFEGAAARWSAVSLLTAVLAVPVAGTAVPIMDPYLDSRAISTPLILFAIDAYFRGRKKATLALLAATAVVHPQMVVYGMGLLACAEGMTWLARMKAPVREEVVALPSLAAAPVSLYQGFHLGPAQGAYREVLYSRSFFFVFQWPWWEWFGAIAPILILYGLLRWQPRGTQPVFRRIIAALLPFALLSIACAVVLCSSHEFDYFVRLQPMRSFHLLYIFLFLFLGGLLGEYVLRARVWLWMVAFLPLGSCMYLVAQNNYPHSAHVEWPAAGADGNPWLEAFYWVRANTPKNAVFALDPRYLSAKGEDGHGFRAVAERSALADFAKDSGAATMFPQLADEWKRQQQAQAGWSHFGVADFQRLAQQYPVDWLLLENPIPPGLTCPYRNATVSVCRLPH